MQPHWFDEEQECGINNFHFRAFLADPEVKVLPLFGSFSNSLAAIFTANPRKPAKLWRINGPAFWARRVHCTDQIPFWNNRFQHICHGPGTTAMPHLRAVLSVGARLYGLQWGRHGSHGGHHSAWREMESGWDWATGHQGFTFFKDQIFDKEAVKERS